MKWSIPDHIRAMFTPTTREAVVVLEAVSILYDCTFGAARAKFPEIQLDLGFSRRYDATVWELELGELLARARQKEFDAEQRALRKASSGIAKQAHDDPDDGPGAGVPAKKE